ncbi:uracil-DNA glycosylase family protein [Aurantiacibacter gangjinensis]|uniref:Uracil-DNA glycosylase-like domain-containing protein n=1 Tax=Aurantiacibacter gangjinensis TaxID=502682 RepID=A0A0G9MSD8_9SPHN|nr:uracil-DNA glycosylase family protein [Aurantiacibacter gangjinensis]APE28890.1 Uracil-DNA glycosylase [Aurantiacibacter gangjinensis]KLE33646.1 hypothetical protein AAW01_03190 [Aurantiacibacter gangjinensis]
MNNHTDKSLAEQFSAAQDWWRDAGVDYDFSDDVQVMLADEEPEAEPERRAPPPAAKAEPEKRPAIESIELPGDLAAFCDWWAGPANPFARAGGTSVAARGEAGAPVMVIAAMPESGDSDVLLSGPHGKLLGNILRALDIDPEQAYFASALPTHTPLPDWEELAFDGLGQALSHHVTLAKPQRILCFGSKIPTLFGHDPASSADKFSNIAGIPTLATFAPDRLLDHARQRARLWQRLLEWTKPA